MKRIVWTAATLAATLAVACSEAAPGTVPALADAGPGGGDALLDVADTADTAALPDTDFDTPFACTDGAKACHNAVLAKVCVDGGWIASEKCADGSVCLDGECATPTDCTPGAVLGCEGAAIERVCTSNGKAAFTRKCPGQQQCAAGQCRDVVCTPKSPACTSETTFHVCTDDGQGWGATTDCKSGAVCLGGTCLSLCETNLKFASNVGCEYWAVDLDNDPSPHPLNPKGLTPEMVPHSVVVSNPGIYDAEVTFTVKAGCADGSVCTPGKSTCGAEKTVCATPTNLYPLQIADPVVPAGQTREFKMPVMNVDGSSISPKAIHLKSTQPVVAFQFNPFDSEGAASNDGSLLLPQNTLGKLYFAVSLPSTPPIPAFPTLSQHGFLTVVAASPGTTTVTVTPTTVVMADAKAGVPQDGSQPTTLAPGKPWIFQLQPHDVLNLESLGTATPGGAKDLTGTRIEADKPIAVFSGHENSVVTDDAKKGDENFETCCTEHLEEQLMPAEAWGSEALCVKSKPRGYDKDVWVVVAGQANVKLQTTPPIQGLHGVTLAQAGDTVRVQTTESFQLQATGKIQVVQFLVGQGQTTDKTGDPTMMLVPPAKQYRKDYVIRTAEGYGTNWATVVRPKGLPVQVDGIALLDSSFDAFGDGSWEYAWYPVAKGTHVFEAEKPFGLMVYGYGNVTAYGYPGGMNLAF